MTKLGRMKKGYEIARLNARQMLEEKRPNAYIDDHQEELGGDKFLYNFWTKFGGCFIAIFHPILVIRCFKLTWNK